MSRKLAWASMVIFRRFQLELAKGLYRERWSALSSTWSEQRARLYESRCMFFHFKIFLVLSLSLMRI